MSTKKAYDTWLKLGKYYWIFWANTLDYIMILRYLIFERIQWQCWVLTFFLDYANLDCWLTVTVGSRKHSFSGTLQLRNLFGSVWSVIFSLSTSKHPAIFSAISMRLSGPRRWQRSSPDNTRLWCRLLDTWAWRNRKWHEHYSYQQESTSHKARNNLQPFFDFHIENDKKNR